MQKQFYNSPIFKIQNVYQNNVQRIILNYIVFSNPGEIIWTFIRYSKESEMVKSRTRFSGWGARIGGKNVIYVNRK